MRLAESIESATAQSTQDEQARATALDVTRSFIVKAPAGSGKTELLTRRFLALLSVVEEPEEVLAITFTRAATAEMRTRVIDALQKAAASRQEGDPAENTHALAAREHAEKRGWSLLEQPHRLNIQTIDSLCLQIAHDTPLLSRLGGRLQPTEEAGPMYALAARRTMEGLARDDSELGNALRHLLRLRDVNLQECEDLIADMLCNRDRWLGEFSEALQLDEAGWASLRARLEGPFQREHARVITRIRGLLRDEHARQILEYAAYACRNNPKYELDALLQLRSLEDFRELRHYRCLRQFLLTSGGTFWKKLTKNEGFPAPGDGGSKRHKDGFTNLLRELEAIDGLAHALTEVDCLPQERFSDEQWQTIRAIFTVLLHAAAQLRVVFAERSAIDFVETGITAQYALSDAHVRLRWSGKVRHLLVDEFQDTSRRQYELLSRLVQDWDPGDQRTCFLVGDPMQSIYLFRQAELALFNEVQVHGLGAESGGIQFQPLTLSRNFRSTAGIVEPLNAMFAEIEDRHPAGARHFAAAVANAESAREDAVHIFAQMDDGANMTPATEAARVVELVRRHLPAIEEARQNENAYRVGILVRSKAHAVPIAEALRDAGIAYRAVELENLEERQEIQDLLSLVRALLSPLDRIAWLSILRAPWCGLTLADLHMLSGNDDTELLKRPMSELLTTRLELLSEDGARRAGRLSAMIQLALSQRFSGHFSASPCGFAAWVERTWNALGGPHCVDANQAANVEAFFKLLGTFTPDGMEASAIGMAQRLSRLFALPATNVPEKAGIQIMTIHKAKGLGFDVVLVPALERSTRSSQSPLLLWMTRTRGGSAEKELLIAPIGSKADPSHETYKWIKQQKEREENEELVRLLYVACTRARSELHLFGAVKRKVHANQAAGALEFCAPKAGTLLAAGWPYLQRTFEERLTQDAHAVNRAEGPRPFLVPPRTSDLKVSRLAASAADPAHRLRRLPSRWFEVHAGSHETPVIARAALLGRPAASKRASGAAARAAGIAVHGLLQQFAGLPADSRLRHVASAEPHWRRVASALLRNANVPPQEMDSQVKRVVSLLDATSRDPLGAWVMGERKQGRTESEWVQTSTGGLRMLRADRVFPGWRQPVKEGDSHLWIVDYKTTDALTSAQEQILLERAQHQEQLAAYGNAILAALGCNLPLRLALYYPSLPYLDWWPA